MSEVTSAEFAEFLYDRANGPMDEALIAQAKMCLTDYMSCLLYGENTVKEFAQKYVSLSGERGILQDAMILGVTSHVAELDDGHRYAAMHLAAPIISALFAAARKHRISADAFLRGIVTGYEAAIRLSISIQPFHKKRGFHTTGTCGTVGAAAAVAAAMSFTKEEFIDAIAASLTDAAGLLATNDHGALLKPYNAGRAAAAGINAAFAAKAGMTGRNDFLNTSRGFYNAYAGQYNSACLTEDGEKYTILSIYRKLYPSCRHSHAPIEAVLKALQGTKISPEEIDEIIVDTYDLAVKGHDSQTVTNAASAKMSIPYCVAAACIDGTVSFDSFDETKLNDPVLTDLAQKVTVNSSEELSALTPQIRAAIVTVRTKNGDYRARVDYPKGEPENPMTAEELEEKFLSLGRAAGKKEDELTHLLAMAENFEDNIDTVVHMI